MLSEKEFFITSFISNYMASISAATRGKSRPGYEVTEEAFALAEHSWKLYNEVSRQNRLAGR